MSSLLARVNPVSIVSVALAVASLFLPWWGVDITGVNINRVPIHRNLWNPPRFNTRIPGATTVYWNFALSSISVLILALIAASLIIVGSVTLLRRYLLAGLILSVLSLGVYALAVDLVTRSYCLIAPLCVSGPIGAESFSGASGLTVVWGFQSGYYIFILAILALVGGLLFNRLLTSYTVTTQTLTS